MIADPASGPSAVDPATGQPPGAAPLPPPGGIGRFAAGASMVALAAMLANVLAYALRVGGNKVLNQDENGALGALIALLTVFTVLQIGTQTVCAVRMARADADPDRLIRTGLILSGGSGVLVALAAPAITAGLHLPGVGPILALAAAIVPLNATGAYLGLLQGTERFGRLAAGTLVAALGRSGGGLIGLALGHNATGTMLGVAAGCVLAVVVVRLLAGPARTDAGTRGAADLPVRLVEALAGCSAMLAMLALVNADLLLARAVLPASRAGEYAVGAILTNAAYWAPQVVAVVALPRLARGHPRALVISAAIISVTGIATVGGTALLSGFIIRVIAKDSYDGLSGELWLFAATGAAWALVNLLLTARIAARARWVAAPLWIAVGLEAALVLGGHPHSLLRTVGVALTVALLSVVVAVALHRWPGARPSDAGSERPVRGRHRPERVQRDQPAAGAGQSPGL
jgi:O-antigen/teichoic acid export membrane protein